MPLLVFSRATLGCIGAHLEGSPGERGAQQGVGEGAGWIGIMMYSISSGLPILIQGFLGTIVRELPNVMSFSGYVLHVSSHVPPPSDCVPSRGEGTPPLLS